MGHSPPTGRLFDGQEPSNPMDKSMYFLGKAVGLREAWYAGREQEIAKARAEGQPDYVGRVRWAERIDAKELTSNNRWHMMQSVANGVISVARYLGMAVFELREIKLELREVKKALREK
jgi:hypothetical protein